MNKNIFITGITGFLGSHIANQAYQEGYSIYGLSNKRPHPKIIKDIKFKNISSDIRQIDNFKNQLVQCDTIIHSAAIFDNQNKNLNEINVDASVKLFEYAIKYKIKYFIFISTRATFGISNDIFKSNEGSKNFDNHKFIDQYVKSKLEAEKKIIALNKNITTKLIILCPTAMIGPNDEGPTPIGKLVKHFAFNKIIFFVDGYINLVDVRDVAETTIKSLSNNLEGKFGTGNTNTSIRQFIKIIKKSNNHRYLAVKINFWLIYFSLTFINKLLAFSKIRNFADPYRLWRLKNGYSCFDSSKIVKKLKFRNRSIEETVKDIINE